MSSVEGPSQPVSMPVTVSRTRGSQLRPLLAVACAGYLAPCDAFAGRVHSVFERACNITLDDGLLTLVDARGADGPRVCRLSQRLDLRRCFAAGEAVACHDGRLQGAHATVALQGARVWRPPVVGTLLPRSAIEASLHRARIRLDARRRSAPSVLDREAAATVSALTLALRRHDVGRLLPELVRLAGWGEGLTPAGDDFLVGIAAALQAPLPGRAARQHVLAALGPALRACSERTTPIAAHYLRLAGDGHFDAPLLALRDALLAWRDAAAVDAALERLLDIGASSGADMLGGLLAGLDAVLWPHTVPMAA